MRPFYVKLYLDKTLHQVPLDQSLVFWEQNQHVLHLYNIINYIQYNNLLCLSTTCVVNIIILYMYNKLLYIILSHSCSVRVLTGNFHPSGDNNK